MNETEIKREEKDKNITLSSPVINIWKEEHIIFVNFSCKRRLVEKSTYDIQQIKLKFFKTILCVLFLTGRISKILHVKLLQLM